MSSFHHTPAPRKPRPENPYPEGSNRPNLFLPVGLMIALARCSAFFPHLTPLFAIAIIAMAFMAFAESSKKE